MIIKITICSWRFTFSMAPITHIIGVNSILEDGNHIIMWDFDASDFWTVHDELLKVQQVYKLPNVYITETSPKTGFHAWCFKKVDWHKLVEILAFTKGIDYNYFKYGIYRGKFTLRVSSKCGRKIQPAKILKSKEPEEIDIHELRDWVKYETLADGRKSKKYELIIRRRETPEVLL